MSVNVLSIEKLRCEPFSSILCYPRPSKDELDKRIRELAGLGISAIEFAGEKKILNMPVLGKGCVGLVVIAHLGSQRVALKIRRVDAGRDMMFHEAQMLRVANSVSVGPKLIVASEDFLLMQLIEGSLLPKWLYGVVEKKLLIKVLLDLLEQCWRLDMVHLDHGELSYAPKHVIVDPFNRPFIVDFETASLTRKPSNVTSLAQFLFISGALADKITGMLDIADKNAVIEALRRYKADKNRQNFENILAACFR
ncbi:MAG: serine/threonine protein kinase [Nitrososphaerota archaeon]|nr:serine/threonine protein kinase [Candidatus Bathyarchaeota archaeon]MDW8193897.1 serine/threonine protein kinase [Nitrososphaerota archaeon]